MWHYPISIGLILFAVCALWYGSKKSKRYGRK